jgi:muramoyltetrapeptide carboxypeptidase LdcA involved in peptidoglycan recycling
MGWFDLTVLFSLYVNDIPTPSNHEELAIYADDTAVIATSRKPTLLVNYLESYMYDMQRWLSEWRIAIYVSKSSAIIFTRHTRRFIQTRPVTYSESQSNGSIQLVILG